MTVNWGSPDSLSQAAIQIEQPFLWLEEKMTMKMCFYQKKKKTKLPALHMGAHDS